MSTVLYYVLNANGDPEPCHDMEHWGNFFKHADRRLAYTECPGGSVITVFLAIDHDFPASGPPVLWETSIVGGPQNGYFERYTSVTDAKAGHDRAVHIYAQALEDAP